MNETGQARVLSYGNLRSAVAMGNEEVVLVLAAALNPTMFKDKVEVHEPIDPSYVNYMVFKVLDSGNAYAISLDTIILHAARLYAAIGRKCEVLSAVDARDTGFYIS